MGRSPRFCFSIKACAGNADDGDFSTLRQVNKSSPEKRRWSFRKKHARHNVPSNTIISEPLPIFNENQNQEANAVTFYSEKAPSDQEKASIVEQITPTLQVPSVVVSPKEPEEFTSTSTVLVDKNIPEHSILVIQTSIRRHLAQNEFQKIKNVVKIQAAARGYLVRRQAAGTLRCIQAIVKMQALVRARRYVRPTELTEKDNLDDYVPADVVKHTDTELNKTPSAIRKLVSSAFARQLLDSTPKAKSIRISSDPLRPDSAWNWLERWMALTSMDQHKNQDDLKDMKIGHCEIEGDLITKSSKSTELSDPACISDQFFTSVVENELRSCVQETDATESEKSGSKREAEEFSDYLSDQMQQPSDANLHLELGNPNKPDYTEDNHENGARNELSDADENEEGKALNCPDFAAVKAKFEELSSAPDSNRHFDYSKGDVSVSKSTYSQADFTSKEESDRKSVYSNMDDEVNLNEKPSSHSPKGQGASSGFETEISPELRTSGEINHGVENFANGSLKFDETEAQTENNLSNLVAVQQERKEESGENAPISVSPVEAVPEEEDEEVNKPLQYGSPKNHTFVEDSPLRVRTAKVEDNNIPARRKKPKSTLRNSPTHTKNVKRPNSSGSDKSNHVDHEYRNSTNSLPSYMKLTESAKAKINTSFCHKSSIGLQHRDNLVKKRHSFPIGNVKQGLSPRMQSPKSQTSQDLKGNGVSSDISSTERRWQI